LKQAVLAGAAIFAVIGCGGPVRVDREAQEQAKKTAEIVSDPTILVDVATPQIRSISESAEVTGSIATGQSSNVGAKGSGRLIAVNVKDGDTVVAGQVLGMQDASQLRNQLQQAYAQVSSAQAQLSQAIKNARINPTVTSAQVRQAEAGLRSARAQLLKAQNGARPQEVAQAQASANSARTNLETQEKELQRVETLAAAGAIAQSRVDAQRNAVAAARAQLDNATQTLRLLQEGTRTEDIAVAREAVRQAEEQLRNARAQKDLDSVLQDQVAAARAQVQSAQANVRVIQQQIDDLTIRAPFGGTVSGQPAQLGTVLAPGTPLLTLIGEGSAYFEGEIPEQLVPQIPIGQDIEVRIDALDRTVPARIASIDPIGSSVGRQFKTRIDLGALPMGLKPGMFARGRITLREAAGATVVPASSVVKRDGRDIVFVVDGGVAKSYPVTLGLRQGADIQVKGLPAGLQVIVRGQESLDDGSKIRTASAGTPAAGESGAVKEG